MNNRTSNFGRQRMQTASSFDLPVCTTLIIGLCVFLQAYVFLLNPPLNQFTLNALLVIYSHQYWRIITSAFFHGGLMHIAVNMMSFMWMGASLERSLGTLQLGFVILWQTIFTGCFNVMVSWILSLLILNDLSYLKQNSVGFSGVYTYECVFCYISVVVFNVF
mmetsp:Transcript_48661/g.62456  ORF Transcript_48661/g.62456 Transcript_48661/m.62456 type:complete len:163 (-) Transcript_48661:75-563(-)